MRKYFLLRDETTREPKTHLVRDSTDSSCTIIQEISAPSFYEANKQGKVYCQENGLRFYDKSI